MGFVPALRDMSNDRLRRQIAFDAARLMYNRQESEYYRAKLKAARRICRGWVKPVDLPTNAEIRDQIQTFARLHEGYRRTEHLREMRIEALRLMRHLRAFRPRLIGSTLTGHVRQGSDIDLHVFSDSIEAVTAALDHEGIVYDVERKRVRKHGEERVFTHVHVQDRFPIELTIYAASLVSYAFKSSITGKTIERASIAELEELLAREYPDLAADDALEEAVDDMAGRVDRFQMYQVLLLPLERVKGRPQFHPEGDALYHSLQVFDLASHALPHDEEFLLAALLHDVGKAIDPADHVRAGLEALEGFITPRTAWLIEHHMEAHALHDGTIGARARRRLAEHEDYEELVLLGQCDRQGRQKGVETPDLEEALAYLRDLARTCGE
jgi:predicted nucleotidyltransferase